MTKSEVLNQLGLNSRYQFCELVQSTPKQYSAFFNAWVNILIYRQWDTHKQIPTRNNMHIILLFVDGQCYRTYETNRPLYTLDGLNNLIFNKEI